MPLYTYQCLDCGAGEARVAGLDDHTALCQWCRGLMLRQDEDVFKPYFQEDDSRPWPRSSSGGLNY